MSFNYSFGTSAGPNHKSIHLVEGADIFTSSNSMNLGTLTMGTRIIIPSINTTTTDGLLTLGNSISRVAVNGNVSLANVAITGFFNYYKRYINGN
jgi:hypothetical protein